jgi:hypothetical protein
VLVRDHASGSAASWVEGAGLRVWRAGGLHGRKARQPAGGGRIEGSCFMRQGLWKM